MDHQTPHAELAARHLKTGWLGLAVFLSVGLLLEALHGFKVGIYTQPMHHWRRELWTLAHAHGALISVVNIAFALALSTGHLVRGPVRVMASLFNIALILMPLGFWLGGLGHSETDPGVGVLMVPVGGVALVAAVLLVGLNLRSHDGEH